MHRFKTHNIIAIVDGRHRLHDILFWCTFILVCSFVFFVLSYFFLFFVQRGGDEGSVCIWRYENGTCMLISLKQVACISTVNRSGLTFSRYVSSFSSTVFTLQACLYYCALQPISRVREKCIYSHTYDKVCLVLISV